MTFRLRNFVVLLSGLMCLSTFSGSSSAEPPSPSASTPAADSVVYIPGPLRSFLRMAGISQKVAPDDVLPLLARNAATKGYVEGVRPTEFWLLLERYVQQAKELRGMAGAAETIHVASCEQAGPLLRILGYKLRQGCIPKDIALVTDVPERAFLTLDSGFPLTDLEEALQKGVPFVYPYSSAGLPALLKEGDWISLSAGRKDSGDLLSVLLHNPDVAHLYWALSQNDSQTRTALRQSPGLGRLLPYAAVLDFYGSEISIRSGRVVVPGEKAAEPAWKELAGESPESSGSFVLHLLAKDNGWLAAYYDTLARLNRTQQDHFTQMPRMKDLYEAFRVSTVQAGATRGIFRKAPELVVLYTRLEWEANGDPHIPGNLDVWKDILNQKTSSKVVHDWSKRTHNWNRPDQLVEALTAFSRAQNDTGPLPIYMTLNQIDSGRPMQERLSPATVRLLAKRYSEFGSWYLVFSEFPALNDASISSFISAADAIDKISNRALRANVLGAMQANIGLWQIFARQGQIRPTDQNATWQKVVGPFAATPGISSSIQLFDTARNSLGGLMLSVTGKPDYSQDDIVELLAGPPQKTLEGQRIHRDLTERIRSVLDDQRLVSLDTLAGLSSGMEEMAHGTPAGDDLLSLAGELREFEMPHPIFTNGEKGDWAPIVYSTRHTELQVQTDLTKVIKTPGTHAQLEAARGQLAPFLRDTLVGLNYAYYEPPGAQMLHHNPLFIRAHDFSGATITGAENHWSSPLLFGVGATAGGGAYLMGSLSELPYALANAEQEFIVAENIQALIWKEVVPKLLVDATLPRWWEISPSELHAVTLYQRFGEELLSESAANPELRSNVLNILSDRMAPKHLERVEQAMLSAGEMTSMLREMLPADKFYLAAEFRRKFPTQTSSLGSVGQQLEALCQQHPSDTSPEILSRDFGVSHPTFSRTYARDLLKVKPLEISGGSSNRLFGESWESSNLYWARLADESGASPEMLNLLVPELTRRMITKIFATDLDDWPALQRAMQETGEEFRQGKIALPQAASALAQR